MITRRGLFGFACGGVVAAAALPLVGECPSNGRLAFVGEIGPEIPDSHLPKWKPQLDARPRVHHYKVSSSFA